MPIPTIMEEIKDIKFCREGILDRLIAKLDRKLCEARKDKPFEDTLTGMFMFGKHAVSFYYRKDRCEVEVWNPENDCLLDNVSCYCEPRAKSWDNIEIEETDEWDLHGFRDEADYIRWKYC